jgi:alkaline phosphatase D
MANGAAPKPVVLGHAIPRTVRRLPTPFDTRFEPPRPILDWKIASTADPDTPPDNVRFIPDAAAFKQRLNDPNRALLGEAQEQWIVDQLTLSQKHRSTWTVFGNQVLMARIQLPARETLSRVEQAAIDKQWPPFGRAMMLQALGLPPALDSWNGYPAQRARFYKMIEDSDANVIVLTGDTHASWANELMSEDGRTRVGDEFGVSSVTSLSLADSYTRSPDLNYTSLMTRPRGEVKWVEPYKRGYLFVTLTKRAAKAEFFAVSTTESKDYTVSRIAAYSVKPEKGPSVGKLEKAA